MTGLDPLDPDVPDISSSKTRRVKFNDRGRRRVFGVVKEKQPDARRVSAEQIKLRSLSAKKGAEREWIAGEDRTNLLQNHL